MVKKKTKKSKTEVVPEPEPEPEPERAPEPPGNRYPCYVKIADGDGELVELPTQTDGKILLSTVTSQFSDAIGLRYRSESGAWRGVKVSENAINPPLEGWGSGEYNVVCAKKDGKRKLDVKENDAATKRKRPEKEMLVDLIVLGLSYETTDDEMKNYFEKFGELDHHEVKFDVENKKSRGFGFIRYKNVKSVESVLAESHEINGRRCEVSFPKKAAVDNIPTKLFIGRLPDGTTADDLREYFADHGPLKDVYVPNNFRGFGFVTFSSQAKAREIMNTTHFMKGNSVNITYPSPKVDQNDQDMSILPPEQQQQQQHQEHDHASMQRMQPTTSRNHSDPYRAKQHSFAGDYSSVGSYPSVGR